MPRKIRATISNNSLLHDGRERIARDAIKVIAKKGYGNTSIREIARACGMSEGAMYRYVGTKSDILHLISQRMLGFFSIPLMKFMDSLKDKCKSEILYKSWQYYVSLVDEEQDMVMIVHREIVNLNPKERTYQKNLLALDIFEKIIRDGVEDGEFTCNDPKLVAYMMWTLAHDWALKRWFLKGHFDIEQYIQRSMEFIFSSLIVTKNQTETTKEVVY